MKLAAGVFVFASLALSLASASTVYTSPSSFTLATATPVNIGFSGILTSGQLFASAPSVTVSGVTFTTPVIGTQVNVNSAGYYGVGYSYPADYIVNSYNPLNTAGNNQLLVSFATPVKAFGIYYGAQTGGMTGTFTLSDATTFQDPNLPGLGLLGFIGFVSSTPITSFSYAVTQDAWIVENLVTAAPLDVAPSPVPEPATAWLTLAAAALLFRRGF